MSVSNNNQEVLEKTEFVGEVSFQGKTVPIIFRAWACSDCRLQIKADVVDGTTFFMVIWSHGKRTTGDEEVTLTGTSKDGKTSIAAEHAVILGHGHDDGQHWISFRPLVCKLTVSQEDFGKKPFVRLWFRSFSSFRNPPFKTRLGTLVVCGAAQDVGVEDISGYVALEAPSADPGDEWRNEAGDFLKHMHSGLALAHGGRLQTPMLEYEHGHIREMTFYDGSGFTRELPVQHSLHQELFIKVLIERYERSGPLAEILWTALGWMQADTTIDELRFLSAMTALESIIEDQLPTRRGTIIEKKAFEPLRTKIQQLIAEEDTLTEEVKTILMANVSGINRKVLSLKIQALFNHCGIPKRDFEGDVIRGLIKLRNDVIHRGFAPDGVDLWPSIVLVRELITRVLLKEVGFIGRYCCHIGGSHDRDFPGEMGD
jgi:hypothetical protein